MSNASHVHLNRMRFGLRELGALAAAFGLVGIAIASLSMAAEPPIPFGSVDSGGSALLEGWLGSPVHLAILLVAVGSAAATIRLQRGRRGRYEPLALVALACAAVVLSMTMALCRWVALHPQEPALDALRLTRSMLALTSLLGVAALVRAATRPRGERRGIVFALAAAGIAASIFLALGWMVFVPSRSAPGIELARLAHVLEQPARPSDSRWPVASVDALGGFAVEGRALDERSLRDALREAAARMPARDGIPDLPLVLRVDARASFRAVAELAAAATDARIWKLQFAVEREGSDLPGYRAGLLPVYLPVPAGERSRREPRELRVLPAPREYLLDGLSIADPAALMARASEDESAGFALVAAPEMPWSRVAAFFDAPEWERGDASIVELRAEPR